MGDIVIRVLEPTLESRESVAELVTSIKRSGYSVALEELEVKEPEIKEPEIHEPGHFTYGLPVVTIAIFIGSGVVSGLISVVVNDVYNSAKKWARDRYKKNKKRNKKRRVKSADDRIRVLGGCGFVIYGPDGEIWLYWNIDASGEHEDRFGEINPGSTYSMPDPPGSLTKSAKSQEQAPEP
jgi:hypothetical protein